MIFDTGRISRTIFEFYKQKFGDKGVKNIHVHNLLAGKAI